jgi:deoxyribodipyrimidine photo-lyase
MENLTGWLLDDPETRGRRLAERLIVHSDVASPAVTFAATWQAIVESPFRGGRQAAVERLRAIDPIAYGRSRNHVGGEVTRLSPWLRHGVLSLAEVRDAALAQVRDRSQADKLVSELGWRDYWQRVYAARPEAVWDDLEPPAAVANGTVCDRLPDDVATGATGMACIDAFSRKLTQTGWLHNHERMWLASWLVHTRRVAWQVGAAWFLEHLLDADPASNNFSWQWVAGTFSNKPYIFNRENLERYTDGLHCSDCPVAGRCDVEGSYDELTDKLFAEAGHRSERLRIQPTALWHADPPPGRSLVWLTLDSLGVESPALHRHPSAPIVFVFDPAWLDQERPSLKRLVFIVECLTDVPGIEIWHGDPAAVLTARAAAVGASHVCVATTPCPLVRGTADRLSGSLPVVPVDWPAFCDASHVTDLGRFSRYWNKVSKSAMQPTA